MLTSVQYRVLKAISSWSLGQDKCSGKVYEGKNKLAMLLGPTWLQGLKGKTVIDFGCGEGIEVIELARQGAARVIGVDIRENILSIARNSVAATEVEDRCEFTSDIRGLQADVIVSIDAFEHFADPGAVLEIMHGMLAPGGELLACFGPTWYHPYGGHLFSVFPWAHLIFSEAALIRWRSDFKTDGATRFHEVEGGLNQMTIWRFEHLVSRSSFRILELETVPIRKLRFLHNRLTREFTTAMVRCRLQRD